MLKYKKSEKSKLLNKSSISRGYGFMCDGDYYKHCQQYDFHTGTKSILI